MMKIISITLLSILFLTNAFASESKLVEVYGNAFKEMKGEIPVIHLKGNEYEMGKQYGYLEGERIKANIENLKSIGESQLPQVKFLPNSIFTWLRFFVGMAFYVHFPTDVQDHIQGMVAGAKEKGIKLSKFDIAFVNSVIDIVGIGSAFAKKGGLGGKELEQFFLKSMGVSKFQQQCDSMAAWGARTVNGKTYQTRNTDINTGAGIEKYPVVIITKRDGKIPLISASFSGMIGVFTGMNAYGVALGQVWAFSEDIKLTSPWQLSIRQIFYDAKTSKEVLNALRTLKVTTYGNNFVIADAGGHSNSAETGFSIEMTGKDFAYFTENDQHELEVNYNGESYGFPITNAVYRGDLALDPKIRSKQFAANGPDGDPRESQSYINRYKGQYNKIKEIENRGDLIGKAEAEYVSRETAMRNSSLQTTVYANTDRDIWVSYAKMLDNGTVIQAYEQEYVNYPFHEYLVDLKVIDNEIVLKNWFKARHNLKVKHLNGNQILIEKVLDLKKEESIFTGLFVKSGETVELYENNKLIDRMDF